MNLVDFIIIFLIILAVFDGWRSGFLVLIVDLIAFAAGVALAFAFGLRLGELLSHWLPMSVGLRPFFGFAILFLVTTIGVRLASRPLNKLLIARSPSLGAVNHGAGAALNFAKQVFALSVSLNILLFLPVVPYVRKEIQRSRLAPSFLVSKPFAEDLIARIVAPAVYETEDFLTTKTVSDKSVVINTPIVGLVDDHDAERAMYLAVNQERADRGILPLTWNDRLAQVARLQSRDMWRRQYFAHTNPDGADPFARLHQAGISYLVAGENLALAPSTPIAHQGLMDSPEHKDNILSPDYGQIGIGVVRNGLYGAMYTQEFTN